MLFRSVLGDGQTEQYYLEHLKGINGYRYSIRPHFFSRITIEAAELLIDELISGGCDYIVYLMDFDTIVKQKKLVKYNRIIKKYRNNSDVLICESMPCIEFWFILHYIKTTRIFQNADEAVMELKRHLPEFSKERTFLENAKWVNDLCSDGKLTSALRNASEINAEKDLGDTGAYFPFTKIGLGIKWFEDFKTL